LEEGNINALLGRSSPGGRAPRGPRSRWHNLQTQTLATQEPMPQEHSGPPRSRQRVAGSGALQEPVHSAPVLHLP